MYVGCLRLWRKVVRIFADIFEIRNIKRMWDRASTFAASTQIHFSSDAELFPRQDPAMIQFFYV
jgi:hypothetical protein